MTKKLILILLCFLMIVLPACAKYKAPDAGTSSSENGLAEESTTDAESTTAYNPVHDIRYYPRQVKYPVVFLNDVLSDAEKSLFIGWLEAAKFWTDNIKLKPHISDSCDESVSQAYWIVPNLLRGLSKGEIWSQTVRSKQIVVVKEDEILPSFVAGDEVYVFVPYTLGSSSSWISEITGLSVLDGEAELSFVHARPVVENGDYHEAIIVLKVKADFFEM